MLEIGGVEDAGAEHDDLGIADAGGRDFRHGVVQAQPVLIDAADFQPGHEVGEHAQGHVAVFHHIGDAGGGAGVVLQHHELAGFVAHDIGAADMHIGVERHVEADHRLAVAGIAQHQFARDNAVLEDLALVVNVVKEHVQRADALDHAGLDLLPFRRCEYARDQVEGQDAVDRGRVRIDREGDAPFQQIAFGVGGSSSQGFDRQRRQPRQQQRQSGMGRLAGPQQLAEEAPGVVALQDAVRLGLGLALSLTPGGDRHPRLRAATQQDRHIAGGRGIGSCGISRFRGRSGWGARKSGRLCRKIVPGFRWAYPDGPKTDLWTASPASWRAFAQRSNG